MIELERPPAGTIRYIAPGRLKYPQSTKLHTYHECLVFEDQVKYKVEAEDR